MPRQRWQVAILFARCGNVLAHLAHMLSWFVAAVVWCLFLAHGS